MPFSRSNASGHSLSLKFVTSTQKTYASMSVLPSFLLFARKPAVLLIPLPSLKRKNRLKTSSGWLGLFVFLRLTSKRRVCMSASHSTHDHGSKSTPEAFLSVPALAGASLSQGSPSSFGSVRVAERRRLPLLRYGRSLHNTLNSPGPYADGAGHGVNSVALLEFT